MGEGGEGFGRHRRVSTAPAIGEDLRPARKPAERAWRRYLENRRPCASRTPASFSLPPPPLLSLALLLPPASAAPAAADAALTPEARIEALIARMTVQEKAGQLTLYGPADIDTPNNPQAGWRNAQQETADVRAGRLTGLFNNAGLEGKRRLQQIAVNESRLGIPLIFGADVIHGFRTMFPMPLAEASSWEPDLAERTARAAAVEATADGFRWTFAPMVDIARDALGPRPRRRGRGRIPLAAVRSRPRARLPGPRPFAARRDAGHAQALRGLRRGRRRARLQRERHLAADAARGVPAAVPCGAGRRCTLGDERLQRDRRRALHRQPLAAHGRAARRMEVPGLRGLRLHGRRRTGGARLRRQPTRGRQAGLPGRHRREHAERPVHALPARPRGLGRGAHGAARRGRAPRAARQAEAGPVRRPDARPRRPTRLAAPREPRIHLTGPRERAPLHRDAEERAHAAAAAQGRHEDRADRALRRGHRRPDGRVEPVPRTVGTGGHRPGPARGAGAQLVGERGARLGHRVDAARRHRRRGGGRARCRRGGARHRREREDVGRGALAHATSGCRRRSKTWPRPWPPLASP